MAFIPVPGHVQAVLEWSDLGEANKWTNTLWFENQEFSTSDMAILGNDLLTWANTNLLGILSSDCQLNQCTVYAMADPTAPKIVAVQTPQPGTGAAGMAPISTAAIVTFYTEARGRSGRGRNYLAGFADSDVTATSVGSYIATGIEAAYNDLLANQPLGWQWNVVQRYELGLPLAQGVGRPVLSIDVRSGVLGTQSRRIRRD